MGDIFISYSSEDRSKATSLAAKLRSKGYDVWMDIGSIAGAMNWSSEIVEALNHASTVIFLISGHSVASANCAKEIHLASEKRKPILPIVMEMTTLTPRFEYALAGVQWVTYHDDDAIIEALEKINTPKLAAPMAVSVEALHHEADHRLRLAVLPFDDLSPTHDNGWFADGMMDDLINSLGNLETLRVHPRNDVICYKDKQPRIADVAADLQVQYVVTGTVQKAGPKIRIGVSLSDTHTHAIIWSDKYDGTFDDVFELQDQTVHAISKVLQIKLSAREEILLDRRETDSVKAYELFLRAKDHYFTLQTKSGLEYALQLHQKAVGMDPKFIAAYAEIANINMSLHRHYIRTAETLAKACQAIEKVRELEGESPRWHWIMAHFCIREQKYEAALKHAEAAAHAGYTLGFEALGFVHGVLGNHRESANARETFVAFREHETTAHFNLLISLNELGDTECLRTAARNAVSVYERYLRLHPEDAHSTVHYVNVLSFAGRKAEAIEKGKELLAEGINDGLPLYNLACLFLNLEDTQLGLTALDQSIDKGFLNIDFFRKDRDLTIVRGTPEFDTLIKKLEARIEATKAS